MANKWLTPKNKKLFVSIAMIIVGWYALIGNTLISLPSLPAVITKPLIFGLNLLIIAGALVLYGVFMLWTEY